MSPQRASISSNCRVSVGNVNQIQSLKLEGSGKKRSRKSIGNNEKKTDGESALHSLSQVSSTLTSRNPISPLKHSHPHFTQGIEFDASAERNEYIVEIFTSLSSSVTSALLVDSRDITMLNALTNMLITTSVLATILFITNSNVVGAFVLAFNTAVWLQRFILLMHYSEHRPIFRRGIFTSPLRLILPWVLAPFFGIPPGMYYAHHLLMHHKENNLFPNDLSSTEPYRRDSLKDWTCYLFKYYLLLITLPSYCISARRYRIALSLFTGSCLWLSSIYYLIITGHQSFVIWQLILPFFISSAALMFGNWSQHIFINPDVVTKEINHSSMRYNCAHAINVINHADNQRSFNDGYHIVHHVYPRCHWSEMPSKFMEELDLHAKNDAVIFDQAGFFDVGFNVLVRPIWDREGSRRWLYDHFVHLGQRKRSFDEVMEMLDYRLKPILRV